MIRTGIESILLLLAVLVISAIHCGKKTEGSKISKRQFGIVADGSVIDLYTLCNSKGMEVQITNFGGCVVAIKVPDNKGQIDDVVLGFDRAEDYLTNKPHFGSLIGRYGNRIGKGRFTLEGKKYILAQNNGKNHLHGGLKGFDKVLWQAGEVWRDNQPGLELFYMSRDGEEGYPGNLSVTVTYLLTDENELRIEYLATTDAPTILNLTNHSYFNLAGAGSGDILGHKMTIFADEFTPVDQGLIPTGELHSVTGTPMDFTRSHAIGARIDDRYEQLIIGRGYDHNYVLSSRDDSLALAARVLEPGSGRIMDVYTTQPGIQFYTGNFLDGTVTGKGHTYHHRTGFCLETQHFPDSPNKPQFPSTELRPGQTYSQVTVYTFAVQS